MHRKIYTRKESFRITWVILAGLVLLCVFGGLLPSFWESGMLYLGLLSFLVWGTWQTAETMKWRKKHRMCMATQSPQRGRIVDCVCETTTRFNRRVPSTEYLYYLVVEIGSNGLSIPATIRSDAYTWPVYQALTSPEVDVYDSDTESGYTLDGFQYKSDKNAPDILPESLRNSLPGRDVDAGAWVVAAFFGLLILIYLIIVL